MPRTITILDSEGKDEIVYPIGVPDDLAFYIENGIIMVQWWNPDNQLRSAPAKDIVALEETLSEQ